MGLTSRDALGLSTAGILELTKKLTLEQIGKALGISSPEPHPEAYPEGRAEFGLGALRSQVAGIATAYGTEPNSMSGAVSSRDEGVDEIIQNALSDALELIDAIVTDSESTSFTSALATNRADLEDLYELMAVLRRTFETDVVSLLDVTLGFSDSDGDSG
jgi:predicted lipoprotein